ncbi:NAD-dependent histone deacetylase Hst3p [[Candida] railenensis]|uniref:NAD-dependent histone deacetylase Hst3p n=1 Tax=[Candida] railenensis TaxID=45579 RepID=A0A9P0VWG8_9ASCO|nr:NAD-dependent histone deacetylase Hst3p [[Candida] railenensis]
MKTINLISPTNDDSIKLAEVSKIIFKSKKSTVLTGAGISCNAGIPDFRSSDGLYNMVKAKHPKSVVRGQDLFDISLFRDEVSLSVFCTFMEALYVSTKEAKPTETHKFIKTLKEKNKLLRCYTQNIDGLERSCDLNMGIQEGHLVVKNENGVQVQQSSITSAGQFTKSWKELDVVQLHGNLHQLSCTHCLTSYAWTQEYQSLLSQGLNPECKSCHEKYLERLYSGKRMTGNIGLLRPSIVLYGENHPQAEYLARGLNHDLKSRPDLLLIMGTSLKVDGVKKLVRSLSTSIHSKGGKIIFVNKTPLSSSSWNGIIDYQVLSDCDEFVKSVKREIPDLFLTQEQLDSKKLLTPAKKAVNKSNTSDSAFTPPTTPTKVKVKSEIKSEQTIGMDLIYQIKKEAETYKRMNLSIPTPELTPASSFDEETFKPALRQVSKSQLNRKIKVKKESKEDVKDEKLLKRVSPTPTNEEIPMKKCKV